jgi:hypothetical protein
MTRYHGKSPMIGYCAILHLQLPAQEAKRRVADETCTLATHSQPAKIDRVSAANDHRRLGVCLIQNATEQVSCTRRQPPQALEQHFFIVILREDIGVSAGTASSCLDGHRGSSRLLARLG